MSKLFSVELITPQKIVFRGKVTSVTVPGVIGSFQVLYNHAPIMSELAIGEIKVKDGDGQEIFFAVSGGFVKVKDNNVVILVEAAERVSDIDTVRAEESKMRAQKRLRDKHPGLDIERTRASMARAENRLRIVKKHSIN